MKLKNKLLILATVLASSSFAFWNTSAPEVTHYEQTPNGSIHITVHHTRDLKFCYLLKNTTITEYDTEGEAIEVLKTGRVASVDASPENFTPVGGVSHVILSLPPKQTKMDMDAEIEAGNYSLECV